MGPVIAHRSTAPSARATKRARRAEALDGKLTADCCSCEPAVTSKSHGHADRLIDLVLSSSTDDTVRVFTETVVLTSSLSTAAPLTIGATRPLAFMQGRRREGKAKGEPSAAYLWLHTLWLFGHLRCQ